MPTLLPWLIYRPLDPNGHPLPGGQLFSYLAGSSTLQATYGEDGSANPNPVILDAYGQAHVRLGSYSYKLDLFDAVGVHQPGYPVDNVVEVGVFPVAVQTLHSGDTAAQLNTTSAFLPPGALIVVVTTRIPPGGDFGTSRGLTGFAVGDATTMDRWGVSSPAPAGLQAGALTGGSDAPAASQARLTDMTRYPQGAPVLITALGGAFDAAGVLEVSVQYLAIPHRLA